ncbi:hypothetical protein FBUS_04451 [Fasciolopsis buskii]|uniref:Uncharacterized protein n=1 Tax=Fasciolopsis buskii TaxID=27845 RepID=A0A8E0VNS9_9TREM|nr:hypothetical protein FBUS_04451 [Fasciolopsis buski]
MIESVDCEEPREEPHVTHSLPVDPPKRRLNIAVLTRIIYEKLWVRIVYVFFMLCISLVGLIFSWLIYRDASLQLPGLVFDRISVPVLTSLFVFSITEIVFLIVDIMMWTSTLWRESDYWFLIDLSNLLNILLSELPLSVINTYLSACRESAISEYLIAKSSLVLGFVFVRFIALSMFYLMNSTDYGCVIFPEGEGTSGTKQEKADCRQASRKPRLTTLCCDVVRKKRLRRFWLVVRIFVLLGFFLLFLANIMVFKFTFVQTYRGYLEWRRILPESNVWSTAQNQMAERYFQDVEVFLKERELSSRKWLHLVSLEKLLRLQSIGADELIGLNYIQSGNKIYCVFSQLVTFANRTTETSVTCWLKVATESFQETPCDEIMDPAARQQKLVRLKSFKIQFTYKPPDRSHPLGALYYNATRTDNNGTVFTNVPLKMEYFQNTIAHHVTKPDELAGESAVRRHDGWNSGPFRPSDVYLPEQGDYIKYDTDTGDLIPVSQMWRTGFAMCPSTAPTGPIQLKLWR